MKEISLTKGRIAMVSDEDYDDLAQYKWKYHHHGYPVRHAKINGKWKMIYMHRQIMGLDFGDNRQVDHINLDKLDNRRENLRLCETKDNVRNREKPKNNTSGAKGVYHYHDKRYKSDGSDYEIHLWMAYIRVDGKQIRLGYFPYTDDGYELAKQAYNRAAIKYFGEFANVNT